MSELLDNWVARISQASFTDGELKRGKSIGTGFITVYPWLVTCNHVVAEFFQKKSTEILDTGNVSGMVVDFPLCISREKNLYQAEIVISKPKMQAPTLTDIHDVVILKLKLIDGDSNVEDEGWGSQWKYGKVNYEKHRVISKGFFIDKGSLLKGESITSCTDGLIELDLNVNESIGGASGSPVWSEDDHSIIGMRSSQRGEKAPNFKYKKVYMIPMHKILDACPEHNQYLLAYKKKNLKFEAGGNTETFLADIKKEIISCLNLESVKPVFDHFHKKQKWENKLLDAEANCVQMLEECTHNAAKIFRNLTVCTKKYLEELERNGDINSANHLFRDMKKLISLLSLHVLKKESITQLRQDIVYSLTSVNLTIGHESMVSAELVSAARMQAWPRFRKHEERPDVLGQYAVSHYDLESGAGRNDNWIDDIGEKVWRIFFDYRYRSSTYSRQALRDHIGRELCADDSEKKNCYLVLFVNSENKNKLDEISLLNRECRQKFKEAIPELPIVILDNTKIEASFVASDRDLMVEIFNFLDKCDKYEKRNDRPSDG